MDLSKYTHHHLKLCLQELKEKSSGNKSELMVRLQKHDSSAVTEILERVSNTKAAENNLLDMSTTMESAEDPVAKLQDQVAALTATVEVLVRNIQNVLSVSSSEAQAVASNVLPIAGEDGTGVLTAPSPLQVDNARREGNTEQNVNVAAAPLPMAYSSRGENVTQNLNVAAEPSQLANECRIENVTQNFTADSRQTTSAQIVGTTTSTMRNNDGNYFNGEFNNSPQMQHGFAGRQSAMSAGTVASVMDIAKMIPEFCPTVGMTSGMFVHRINQLRRAYQWNDHALLFAVHDKMKGAARQWIHAMPVFHSWIAFEQAFLNDFPSEMDSAHLNMKMMRTRMDRGESYVDYFYRMLALGRQGNMLDATIITYIKNGIYDETVKQILAAMKFSRCSELLQTLTSLNISGKRKSAFIVQTSLTSASIPAKPIQPKTNGPICFRCREKGHIARNCHKLPNQNVKTHNVNNTEAVNVSEEENNTASINTIAPIKELLKNITILGVPPLPCNALIDSGSGKSLIKRSLADQCGVEKLSCSQKLSGFAGGLIWCKEKIHVPIKFDDATYSGDLLVINDEDIKYDVLIGIDVLAKGKVIIDHGICRVMAVGSEKLNLNNELPQNIINKLEETLHENSCCFGENLEELGKSKNFQIDINLTSSKPIARKPYPIPIPKQRVVEEIVQQLLDLGIVRQSHSAYSSPIVLVKKTNGENRLCVDFREINAITEKQPWHMPTVDGVLATLAGKRYFTTLDMMSGYYQLEVEETSRQYTAFVTPNGHFEFCRMPFGLRNAPCAFQRMMAELIAPLNKTVVCYVDEVIIATETMEQNIEVLNQFLKIVREEGLTLRLSKCSFMEQSISFLGHRVDQNGVRPGEKKTLAVKNYPVPKVQMDVRRFLGLASFFRKFVPGFALIAKPLHCLLKKDSKFQWNGACQVAFEKIVELLTKPPTLAIYDMGKEHQLHTDASSIGLAAILLQLEEGVWKPLAYYSRACTDAESKYHAYELEVLAVVEGCERFKMFLMGKEFTVITDCQAVSSIKHHKPMVPRVARWFLKLMEYDYQITHRSGDRMAHVDALSRAPITDAETIDDVSTRVMEITVNDWVSSLQRQDEKLKEIMDVLAEVTFSEQKKQMMNEYCIKNHRLFRKWKDERLLVIPKGMRWRIAKLCHDDIGHPAIDGTCKRILQNFWFPRVRNYVKGYIKTCVECAYHRDPGKTQFAVRTPRSNGLAERVNQAVLNYLKTASDGQRDWDRQVRMMQWVMNTKANSTTKMSPMELIFDFPLRDLSGNKILTALHDDVSVSMNKRREDAVQNIRQAREQWKKRFDAKHRKPMPYKEGDIVLIESPAAATGESRKLLPKFKGPYVIAKVLRFDRYVVEDVDGMQRSNRRYNAVVSSDKMKPWCALLPEADDDGEVDDYLTRDE